MPRSLCFFNAGKTAFAKGQQYNPLALTDWKRGYVAAMRDKERKDERRSAAAIASRLRRQQSAANVTHHRREQREDVKVKGQELIAEKASQKVSYFDKTAAERAVIDARIRSLWSKGGRT